MFCTNCGAELNDDMAFCVHCGASMQRDAASGPQPDQADPVQTVAQVAQAQDSAPRAQSASKKRTVIIAVIALCVVIVAAIALFVGCSMQQKTNEAQELAHQKVAVALSIDAQGLDYASSTPVPMRFTGTAFDGSTVDEEFLYDGSPASVPELERGEYTATVLASPISGNGTMYRLAVPSTTIVVTDYEAEEQLRELGHDELIGSVQAENSLTENVVAEGTALSLTPVAPLDVTDEMINETCDVLESLGYEASKISEHRQLVETARNEAKQEQLNKQITFSDNRFSLKVPASWAGKWSSSVSTIHSINGGRTPNAWEYRFYNTHDFTQSFMVVVQDGGSYVAKSEYIQLPTSNDRMDYLIKSGGISDSELQAVISSFHAKG